MRKSVRNIISTISAIAVMSECLVIAPVNAADDSESAVIYRISCEGTNEVGNCNFIYTLKARDNGNIHIEVQGKDYSGSSYSVIKTIGNLIFNDSMIASIDEVGANGKSYSQLNYCRDIISYDVSNIVYTVSCPSYTSDTMGKTIATYDLYVKEPYLTTNQTINLFGTEVEIPFGEPPIDSEAVIETLNTEVTRLTDVLTEKDTEIDRLTTVLNDYAQKNAALEAENVELSHSFLQYQEEIKGNQEIISNGMARNKELHEQISSLNEELLALQATIQKNTNQIRMYEDKIAKMSATAEVVMTEGDNIFRCDINGDGLIDAVDASIILTAYAKISTGENIQHISQVVN